MHDLELKKEMCKSLCLRVRVGTPCQFFLKRPVLLINFSVASIIVLFVTKVKTRNEHIIKQSIH